MQRIIERMERLKASVKLICLGLEMIAACLMLVGILLTICSLVKDVDLFRHLFEDTSAFREYMEKILTLVIGIEFLMMLCRPNSENVLEVLIFLVARHMIVGETTPYQDFVSVVSVTILCVTRRYLRINSEKRDEEKAAVIREEQEKTSRKKALRETLIESLKESDE